MRLLMKGAKRYFAYLKGRYLILAAALLCGVVYGATSGVGIPLSIIKFFPEAFRSPDQAVNWKAASIAAISIPLIFLLRGVFGFVGAYLMSLCATTVLRKLKQDIFEKVQSFPMAFFDRHTTGDLFVRLNGDTATAQAILLRLATEFIKEPLQMFGALGFLIYLTVTIDAPEFLLVIVVVGPTMLLPVQLMRKRLKNYARRIQESLGGISQQFSENLDAVHEVRLFNLQERENARFNEQNSLYQRITLKLVKYEQTQQPMMEIISGFMIGLLLFYVHYKAFTLETCLAICAALYLLLDPIKRMMRLVSDFYKTLPLFKRIDEILDYESPVPEPENPVEIGRLKGLVRFGNVSFAYNEKVVLKNTSIEIPAGTSCALVGESGAGKSTFVKLLMRFYDPTQGAVSIDGVSLKDMRSRDLRANLGSVPQYPVLFNDTVFENIALAKEGATKEEVFEAAKRAYAHDFILALENGYDTVVGERGDRLSGGQKQRIALARVFLKNAPILILDEATSALDSNSERFIQKALEDLMGNRTAFIIAHRFSTIAHVKKIIVFKDGEIIAFGSHGELFENCPYYKDLYLKQTLKHDQ